MNGFWVLFTIHLKFIQVKYFAFYEIFTAKKLNKKRNILIFRIKMILPGAKSEAQTLN